MAGGSAGGGPVDDGSDDGEAVVADGEGDVTGGSAAAADGDGPIRAAGEAAAVLRVLDQYEDDAVGTGDFGSYVQFEGAFANAVDVDDVPAADAFAAADEAVDKRRLSEADFAAAREALDPAGEYVDLLSDRDDAIDEYRIARKRAREARDALADRLAELRDVADMADANLDAPVDRLRDPIESYNESVRGAFDSFYRSASAREVLSFIERADATPFVDVDVPPTDLREYVDDHAAGDEPLPTLLEYADYSNSKLDHYVDDPGALRTAVAVHRTYVDRIDPEPLTVDWPPSPGDELVYEVDELVPLVSRVADDDTVATLRSIRDLARTDEYARLRRAAVVRDALDDDELALVEAGAVDERVAEAERTLALVEDVLAETERE